MAERLSAAVVLIVVGIVSQTVLPSTHFLVKAASNSGGIRQSSERTPNAGQSIVVGVVVNERQKPVARATVQAFSVRSGMPQAQPRQTVAPRETPKPTVDKTLSSGALVEQFKSEKVFWRQFAIGKEIVDRHDASVLPSLVGWLSHEDRHIRGNVAFICAGLGDPRGFQVITDILTDRSDRPAGQGRAIASSDGRYRVARQIAADRYYAAHLLGDLRDPLGVPMLVPLLKDTEVNSIVPWALGQIGDKRAIGPLLDALDDESPAMRVLAIYALETLNAREALPRLISLLDDHRRSNLGAQVSVADAAKAAIAKLQ